MSPGKIRKKVGAGFLVTLIEGAKENLSIEYNIVVCTSFFKQKKLFFGNVAPLLFFKNLPFGVGSWGLMLFFRNICIF